MVRKNREGKVLVIVTIAIVILVILGFIANRVLIPTLFNTVVNTSVDAAMEQIQRTDFSSAQSKQILESITADGAIVAFNMNSGMISIDSSAPSNKITGTSQYFGTEPTIESEVKTDEETGEKANIIRVRSENNKPEKYNLKTPTNKPLGFLINLGAGLVDLNLTNSLTENIVANIGAGKIAVTFSDKSSVEAALNAGTGSVALLVPKSIGTNVIFSQGIPTDLQLGSDFVKISNGFKSKNYESAQFKSNITVQQGVGGFSISTIE